MITLKNGTIFTNNEFIKKDILIDGKKIIKIDDNISEGKIIDCNNLLIAPSFMDSHVHFREPGQEHKETIYYGSRAAAKGGYTTVFLMPNISPKPNSVENMNLINDLIKKNSIIDSYQTGCITFDQSGLGDKLSSMEEIAPMVCGYSDDGCGVYKSRTMFEAMKIAAKVNKPIISHCEDRDMLFGGVVHEGEWSKKNNVPGIPGVSETLEIARNACLANVTGAHLHVCHTSIKESIDLIRYYKSIGCHISCEATPHHLISIDEDIDNPNDANWKMNPPLASRRDRDALIEGLKDGTVNCIATDHAPHTEEEKARGILKAPFGITGIETSFPLLYTELVKTNKIDLGLLLNKMSHDMAETFNLPNHDIYVGNDANLTIIDLNAHYQIDKNTFVSKGKNTPYNGKWVYGKILYTIMRGDIIYGL